MFKKTISYKGFDGVEYTEDFYFNMMESELAEMQLSVKGGMQAYVRRITESNDTPSLIRIFKDLILQAYGEKSLDGKRFVKSPELSAAFKQTNAYSKLFMELATNSKSASEFLNGILPDGYADGADKVHELATEEIKKLQETNPAASMLSSGT